MRSWADAGWDVRYSPSHTSTSTLRSAGTCLFLHSGSLSRDCIVQSVKLGRMGNDRAGAPIFPEGTVRGSRSGLTEYFD